jgi:RNA polymerase sigma-70 factor (ECF subfamily)
MLLVRETYARACARTVDGAAGVDRDLVEEAVGNALLTYIEAPERYDPERASLQRYLVMAAYRDFQNLRDKEARHSSAARSLSLLAIEHGGEDVVDEQQEMEQIIGRMHAEYLWQIIEEHVTDPLERLLVRLIVDRVRSVQPYTQLLGITHLPPDEQAKEVKRVKDRLKKRLHRIGEHLNE